MTPTETAAILRQFNEWSRGDEDIPQFDPREIGEAIDAAVEMIERLEAAESDALEQARLNGMGASREAALMAKLEAAEKDIAHIKEVEFPRKVRAVAVGWEKKCARLEQERDALRGAQQEPSMPDLLESLRCACNYIDKLGGVSQQYRAMLASLETKP